MKASFFPMFRSGLRVLTRKLATEILVSSIATLLVMAMFSNVMKATPPSSAQPAIATAGSAAQSGEKTAEFMEQVALSHVASLKQAPATSSDADRAAAAAPNALAPAVVPPAPAPHPHDHAAVAVHLAAAANVLPPPRPAFDTPASSVPAPTVVAAAAPAEAAAETPKKEKPHRMIDYGLRPLRFGMHVVTSAVDFVPATGTRVVEGVTSVGDALGSFVKKL